ncbi:MAG: hypothetical protein ACK5LF_21465 [Bacteroides xylanisolvens]
MKTKIEDKTVAVWFSNGAASAVSAKIIIDEYGESNNVLLINNPIKEEDEDNLRFKEDVSNWLDHPIIEAKAKDYPNSSIVEVFDKNKFMSDTKFAICSYCLKKQARYEFEVKNEIDFHVLGFTLEEKHRHERFILKERPNVIPALISHKLRKGHCFDIIRNAGIKLPKRYKWFNNANCKGCVRASSPTYWNQERKINPDVFEQRAIQSREIGCKLVELKGQRIFLDELKPTDKGGKIQTLECGVFCDMEFT